MTDTATPAFFPAGTRVNSRQHRDGVTTGRTTTARFPQGQLRVEVRWSADTVRWPLARILEVIA